MNSATRSSSGLLASGDKLAGIVRSFPPRGSMAEDQWLPERLGPRRDVRRIPESPKRSSPPDSLSKKKIPRPEGEGGTRAGDRDETETETEDEDYPWLEAHRTGGGQLRASIGKRT